MMHGNWFKVRSASKPTPRRGRAERVRSRRDGRRTHFEPLEERLVFANFIPLEPAPSPDVVVFTPGTQTNFYDATAGPTLLKSAPLSRYATFAGETLYQTPGAGIATASDDFFPVDVSKTYALSGWARSGDEFGQRFRPNNLQSFGLAFYDANMQPILDTGIPAVFSVLNSQPVSGDWTWKQYAGVFGGGVRGSGSASSSLFPTGTAFVKPLIIANEHGATDNFISWRDVSITEVPPGTTPDRLALPVIDLSRVDGSDQRHALPLPQGKPYSWSESLVRVDTSRAYVLAGRARNVSEHDERPVGFASLDVDRKLIHPLHVTKYGGATDTTLAAPLRPGDTSLLVTNATGWSNAAWEAAETRSLAWYGYTDSTGFAYPNYTYTRNIAFDFDRGLWDAGAIQFDAGAGAYRIQLLKPWAGPTLSTGAAIRNATSGAVFNQPTTAPAFDWFQSWSEYSVAIAGGVWQNGQRDEAKFRPGTVYIQPVFSSSVPWTDAMIRPQQNTITSIPLQAGTSQQLSMDFDVLAKGAFNFSPGAISGDYNGNKVVDAADYVVWRKLLTASPANLRADGNGDGRVDAADWQVWRSGFGGNKNVVIVSATAQFGTATIRLGESPDGRNIIHYETAAWFLGTDVIAYTLRDTLTGQTIQSSLAVNVLGSNFRRNATITSRLNTQGQVTTGNVVPTVFDDGIGYVTVAGQALNADGTRTLGLLANDTDPTDTLVVRLLSGPTHGTLRLNYDGTFLYTPAAGFTGVDTFRYEAYDRRHAASAVAEITVVETVEELRLDRLHDIGIAMLNYDGVNRRLPITNTTASHFNPSGNPHLSWRVHILPYLGYQSLYEKFRLNEPWNSTNNLPLASQMPNFFADPGATPGTTTRIQVISAEGAPYYWRRVSNLRLGPRLSDFTDGTENSFMAIESGADRAIVWTRPDDLVFNPTSPLAALGTITGNKIYAVMADAQPIVLPRTIDAATFKALTTISGGEILDAATLRREFAENLGGALAARAYAAQKANQYFRIIALGMQIYHDLNQSFPVRNTATNFDANGNPFLSWRVHILPYIGQKNLFDQFHFNEPWDSPHNLSLLQYMPDVYRSVGDSSDSINTRVVTFTGAEAPFGFRTPGTNQSGPPISNIIDGSQNTIMFIEAGQNVAVPWTRPADVALDVSNPLQSLGQLSSGEMRVALFDATVGILPGDIPTETLSGLATRRLASSPASYDTEELRDGQTILDREILRRGRFDPLRMAANNLRQIAIAMQNFHDAQSRFPSSILSTGGQPLLSWRVRILPYMGYTALYNQFHRTEPWDSPHNLELLKYMPDVFRAADEPWDSMTTRIMTFTGNGAPFNPSSAQGPRISDITDGTSRTIMFVEAGRGVTVPWTKPQDLPFVPANPYQVMGELGPNFLPAFFDGSVRIQPSSLPPATLSSLIIHNDGGPTDFGAGSSAEGADSAQAAAFAEIAPEKPTASSPAAAHRIRPLPASSRAQREADLLAWFSTPEARHQLQPARVIGTSGRFLTDESDENNVQVINAVDEALELVFG